MKDPYLKPVVFGGLFITLLSVIFAPGIFLWAILGGYLTVRLSNKLSEEVVSLVDVLLLGIFTGIVGGASLDILTTLSFKSPENQRLIINTLEKKWPKDLSVPNFAEILPSVLIASCILIIIIAVVFAVIGAYIGVFVSRKKIKN